MKHHAARIMSEYEQERPSWALPWLMGFMILLGPVVLFLALPEDVADDGSVEVIELKETP